MLVGSPGRQGPVERGQTRVWAAGRTREKVDQAGRERFDRATSWGAGGWSTVGTARAAAETMAWANPGDAVATTYLVDLDAGLEYPAARALNHDG